MAVDWQVEHKRGSEYLFLPESLIVRPEDNWRVKAGDAAAMLRSFEMVGQLQPVSVQNEGGRPVLKTGFTRYAAAVLHNEGKPDALKMRLRAVLRRASDLDTAIMNIQENVIRTPTTPEDDAANVIKLHERYGKSAEEIADIYQREASWVKGVLNGKPVTEPGAPKPPRKPRAPRPDAPVKPSAKAVHEALDTIADSTAHPKPVRDFAAKFRRFLAGEVEVSAL